MNASQREDADSIAASQKLADHLTSQLGDDSENSDISDDDGGARATRNGVRSERRGSSSSAPDRRGEQDEESMLFDMPDDEEEDFLTSAAMQQRMALRGSGVTQDMLDNANAEDVELMGRAEHLLKRMQTAFKRLRAPRDTKGGALLQFARRALRLEGEPDITFDTLNRAASLARSSIVQLHAQCVAAGVAGDGSTMQHKVGGMLKGCLDSINSGWRLLEAELTAVQHMSGDVASTRSTATYLQLYARDSESAITERNPDIPDEPMNPCQRMLNFVLDVLLERNLRVHEGLVYAQQLTPDGHGTHVWEPLMQDHKREETIMSFAFSLLDRQSNPAGFHWATQSARVMRDVEFMMSNLRDDSVTGVYPDRRYIAFSNGILCTECFSEDVGWTDRFYKWGDDLDVSVQAITYHNVPMPLELWDAGHPMDIPTPLLETIIRTQGMPRNAEEWMYVLMGRMLHDLNRLDKWGVLPFVKGESGTGKSVLAYLLEHMLGEGSQGLLESDGDMKFGTAAIEESQTWACLELRKDSRIPVGRLFSLATGELVGSRHMQQVSKFLRLKCPGWLGGNQVPCNWDVVEAVLRRVVTFTFDTVPEKRDTSLQDRIMRDEIAHIILKCNRMYLMKCEEVGQAELNDVMPRYFRETREYLRGIMDPVSSFVNKGGNSHTLAPRPVRERWMAWAYAQRPVQQAHEDAAQSRAPRSNLGVWTGDLVRPAVAENGDVPSVLYNGRLYTPRACVAMEAFKRELKEHCPTDARESAEGGGGAGRGVAAIRRALRSCQLPVVAVDADAGVAQSNLLIMGMYSASMLSSSVMDEHSEEASGIIASGTVLRVGDNVPDKFTLDAAFQDEVEAEHVRMEQAGYEMGRNVMGQDGLDEVARTMSSAAPPGESTAYDDSDEDDFLSDAGVQSPDARKRRRS